MKIGTIDCCIGNKKPASQEVAWPTCGWSSHIIRGRPVYSTRRIRRWCASAGTVSNSERQRRFRELTLKERQLKADAFDWLRQLKASNRTRSRARRQAFASARKRCLVRVQIVVDAKRSPKLNAPAFAIFRRVIARGIYFEAFGANCCERASSSRSISIRWRRPQDRSLRCELGRAVLQPDQPRHRCQGGEYRCNIVNVARALERRRGGSHLSRVRGG